MYFCNLPVKKVPKTVIFFIFRYYFHIPIEKVPKTIIFFFIFRYFCNLIVRKVPKNIIFSFLGTFATYLLEKYLNCLFFIFRYFATYMSEKYLKLSFFFFNLRYFCNVPVGKVPKTIIFSFLGTLAMYPLKMFLKLLVFFLF